MNPTYGWALPSAVPPRTAHAAPASASAPIRPSIDPRIKRPRMSNDSQPFGLAIARKSSALSSTSSSTPASRATSRSDRPDFDASFTISLARS